MNPFDLPHELRVVLFGGIGLFVGSFLNVAIYRHGIEGQSVTKPRRSMCPSCGRVLTWVENIPVASWVVQLGRCRGNRVRQLPEVEGEHPGRSARRERERLASDGKQHTF